MLSLLVLAAGLWILVKGADWLVRGSSSLALSFGVSQLTIGLTVVAFGTSMPELVVSFVAVMGGNSDIAIGNILGSNIANILLILGLSSLVFPLRVTSRTVRIEIPLCVLAGVAVALLMLDGRVGRIDGAILLLVFAGFMAYIWRTARQPGSNIEGEVEPVQQLSAGRGIGLVCAGLLGLVVGGKAVVYGAVALAEWIGLSQSFVGLTVVAIGTSLPEMATSVMAAHRKNPDIAVGNVVGSNIFNVFLILGLSAQARPIALPGTGPVDIAVVIASALMLLLAMWSGKRYLLDRWEGGVFLAVYASYVAYLAIQG